MSIAPAVPTRSVLLEWLVAGIAILLGIFALWLGRGWFVPMAIAWMTAIVLTATFERIARVRLFGHTLPRWGVYLIGLLGVAAVVLGTAQILIGQARTFAGALPAYAQRIADLRLRLDEVIGEQATTMLWNAVGSLHPGAALNAALAGLGTILGTLVLIGLYVAFMLVDGGGLARKIAAVAPDPVRRLRIAEALAAIRGGVQQYLMVKTLISALTAAVCYVLLRLIGVDFALTWAVLAFLLNFIPSIGSIVATILPVTWAAIQFPSFGPPIAVLATVGAVQFGFGNILDPMLAGRRLNLGPLIIVLSLSFWSMLWGITGAFLAVPMTVVMAIIALHVPPLHPLAVILSGDEVPPPSPSEPAGPAAFEAAPPRTGAPADRLRFGDAALAADVAALRRDRAAEAAAAQEPAAATAGDGPPGLAGALRLGLAEWLADEVSGLTGAAPDPVRREIVGLLEQLPDDPDELRAMAAAVGGDLAAFLRRYPVLAGVVGIAIGFALTRRGR